MNDFIKKKYDLIEELTNGEFGKVYKAKHKLSNELVVIKIEEKTVNSLLLYETKMYNYLKNYNYVSKLRNFFNNNNQYILIIDYHGESLYNLKNGLVVFNNREKIYFINNLLIQLTDALECLHNLNFIYRDVKPQNFCFNNELKVIDLGFCKQYVINNIHIDNKKLNKIIGTPNYISKNVLELNTPSRRDDIESIIFIYIYLLMPIPVWDLYSKMDYNTKKDELILNEIFINLNNDFYNNELNNNNFKKLINIIRNLNFVDKPNYNTFKILIKGI